MNGEEWVDRHGITLYTAEGVEIEFTNTFHPNSDRIVAVAHLTSALARGKTVRLNLEDAKGLGKAIVQNKTTEELNEGWPDEDNRAEALRDFFGIEEDE